MKIAHIYPAVSEVYRTAVEKKSMGRHGDGLWYPDVEGIPS